MYLRFQHNATTTMSTHITKQYHNVTLGPFWEPLVASVAMLGDLGTRPGRPRGGSWVILGALGSFWGALVRSRGDLGASWAAFGGVRGGVWEVLVRPLGGPGPSWSDLGRSWRDLGGHLAATLFSDVF
jgi:hypothetical protein